MTIPSKAFSSKKCQNIAEINHNGKWRSKRVGMRY